MLFQFCYSSFTFSLVMRSRLQVLHTGPVATHIAVFGWVGGHVGHLWPNGDRYDVGLNRGHIGKSFDSKYLENGDKVRGWTPTRPQGTYVGPTGF